MSAGQGVTLLVAAVFVFWMVGAYNRLVRLRNDIGAAWAQIEGLHRRRAKALPVLLEALREPMAAERSTLDSVDVAQQVVQTAVDAMRHAPVRAEAAAGVVGAAAQLDSTLARLLALLDQHSELRAEPAVAGGLRELHDVDQRLAFARQLFNEAVQAYNAAAHQFPTRLLTRMYGFGTAGRL
jgi:LemA protein